jgi:ketosteroid isomerase-like protein
MDQLTQLVEAEKIKRLRSLFSHYFDSRNLDALVGLFAPDALCEFPDEFGGNWRGQAELRKNFQSYMDSYDHDWATIHAITNHVVTFNADGTATGCCYLLDYLVQQERYPLHAVAVFNDLYTKVGEDWLIQRTRIDFHWQAPPAP